MISLGSIKFNSARFAIDRAKQRAPYVARYARDYCVRPVITDAKLFARRIMLHGSEMFTFEDLKAFALSVRATMNSFPRMLLSPVFIDQVTNGRSFLLPAMSDRGMNAPKLFIGGANGDARMSGVFDVTSTLREELATRLLKWEVLRSHINELKEKKRSLVDQLAKKNKFDHLERKSKEFENKFAIVLDKEENKEIAREILETIPGQIKHYGASLRELEEELNGLGAAGLYTEASLTSSTDEGIKVTLGRIKIILKLDKSAALDEIISAISKLSKDDPKGNQILKSLHEQIDSAPEAVKILFNVHVLLAKKEIDFKFGLEDELSLLSPKIKAELLNSLKETLNALLKKFDNAEIDEETIDALSGFLLPIMGILSKEGAGEALTIEKIIQSKKKTRNIDALIRQFKTETKDDSSAMVRNAFLLIDALEIDPKNPEARRLAFETIKASEKMDKNGRILKHFGPFVERLRELTNVVSQAQ